MTRPLFLVLGIAAVLALVSLSVALGLVRRAGLDDATANDGRHASVWSWQWTGVHGHSENTLSSKKTPADVSRTLAWGAGSQLEADLPANVQYIASAGPPTVTITGPSALVDAVELKGDRISLNSRAGVANPGKLAVIVRAPSITRFVLAGSTVLDLDDYRGDELAATLSGRSHISASGTVRKLTLKLSEKTTGDLSLLSAADMHASLSDSSTARAKALQSATVTVSSHGAVQLIGRPPTFEKHITEQGRVTIESATRKMTETYSSGD